MIHVIYIFLILVAAIMSPLILVNLSKIFGVAKKLRYSKELSSLGTFDGNSGRAFLGTGFLDGVKYYFFHVKEKDGGFTSRQIPANEAVLYEETDATPKIEWTEYYHLPVLSCFPVAYCKGRTSKYKIYVKTDTVNKNFKV